MTIEKVKNAECCGCAGCQFVCPTSAITFDEKKGFFYPKIDEKKCINCGKCEKICPILEKDNLKNLGKAFAFQHNTESIRMNSTSGGCFSAIAEIFIENGGIVCGAGFDTNGNVVHKIICKKTDIQYLRGSKYVQSDLIEVFSKLLMSLKEGKKVLFVGTPCQCSCINNIFKLYRSQLILIDFVCYGVPSPVLYMKWRNYLEKKWNNKIKNIIFRDKSYGFNLPNVKVLFEDGNYIEQNYDVKSFLNSFFSNMNVRPSCSNCKYKDKDRISDITMGDCWSIGKLVPKLDDNKGTSVVYVHSEQGENLIKLVAEKGSIFEINRDEAINLDGKKMLNNVEISEQFAYFWNDYSKMEYGKLMRKYLPETLKQRLINIVKPIIKNNSYLKDLLGKLRNR